MINSINMRALDMLRGILALYVIVGHCRWLLWAGHRNWLESQPPYWELPIGYASAFFRFGHEAVIIFFVLSGFFIHLKSATVEQSTAITFDVAKFYRRRAHRLLVPYFFALAVTVCLDSIGYRWFPTLYRAETGDGLIDGNFAKMGYTFDSVLPALVGLPNSCGKSFGTNGPLWSLAFEVCYYVVYPVFLSVRRIHWLFAFLVIPLLAIAQQWFFPSSFFCSVFSCYPVWLAGAALAELLSRFKYATDKRSYPLFLILLGIAIHFSPIGLSRIQIDAVCYGIGVVWLFALSEKNWSQRRLPRLFEWFGIRSYSLYIIHFPVVTLTSAITFSLYGMRPLSGWLALFGVASSVIAGCLSFQLCEKYFLHHGIRYNEQSGMGKKRSIRDLCG
jgi:peptidoglycan/LPS O-acetylase OafA/YrhL